MRDFKKLTLGAIACLFLGWTAITPAYADLRKVDGNSMGSAAPEQQKKIQGKVRDAVGEPLAGASVLVKGTTNGTITNVDGDFSLSVGKGAVVVVSYIGYNPTEFTVSSKDNYDIILSQDTQLLDDVVVVGYGTMKKQNLTGAVSSVNFDEKLADRPSLNLSSALTGLSAGLNISQSSAAPGAENYEILVRGRGTMNDASPLVIVDGVPGALNDVNPVDVESVSVLKDAASSAIYGSRAANGVILVTTKKGAEGKATVTYNGYVGWQNAAKTIDFISDMAIHMELVNEAEGTEHYAQSLINDWRQKSAAGNPLYPNTDWYDEMLKSGLLTEHSLNLRGGNAKTKYAMTLGYLDNNGIIDNSGYKKYSFRVNLQSDVNDWLTLGTTSFGSWSDRDPIDVSTFFDQIRGTTPGVLPKSEDGRWGGTMFEGAPSVANPRAYVDNIRGNYERQKFSAKVFANIKFLKHFTWENSFGFNYDNRRNWEYTLPYSLWNFQTGMEYSPSSNVDKVTDVSRRDYTTVLSSLVRFNYSINRSHNIGVLAGVDQQYNRMDQFSARKADIAGNDQLYVAGAGVDNEMINGIATDDALRSFFGRLNYDYKGRYLFEANARYDGSSRFADGNRWGFFPSFSAGWRVSEEAFAAPLRTVFDNIKLRASWGKLGNNRIGDYTYQVTYGSLLYPFGGKLQQGLAPTSIANTAIKWETTTTTNIGLDLTLLKNKLDVTIEYYDKTTDDILARVPVPYILGNFAAPWQNIAKMKNNGVELQATYHGNIGKDFTYNVSGNLATVHNKVLKYNGDTPAISGTTIIKEGEAYNSFYVMEFDHIIQSQAEIDKLLADGYTFGSYVGGQPQPGDFLYKDTNDDKIFDEKDRVVKSYSSLPKFTYGLTVNMAYKGFDLNIIGQGINGARGYWGNDGYNTFNVNEGFLMRTNVLERWTEQNHSTKYPRLQTSGSALNTINSDYWLYNTSYFRIKSIQLGYTLPQKLTRSFLVERLRVYTNLENYFTFTNFDGYNPENPSMAYPLMKQWVFGLNLTF